MLSLEKRRLLADVTFLYKVLHGIIDIDVKLYVDFYKESDHYSFRHNNKLTLKMRYARTNDFKYTYFHRVVGTWNYLPLSIREARSVNYFKASVKKYFFLWISIFFECFSCSCYEKLWHDLRDCLESSGTSLHI